jgi:hypothetical protein
VQNVLEHAQRWSFCRLERGWLRRAGRGAYGLRPTALTVLVLGFSSQMNSPHSHRYRRTIKAPRTLAACRYNGYNSRGWVIDLAQALARRARGRNSATVTFDLHQ